MRNKIRVIVTGAFSLAFSMAIWSSQSAHAQANYYDNASTLMQSGDGGQNTQMPQAYYPYWTNYLDNLQREGGYYSVTGAYGNSAPVTSYYPANPASDATSPQVTSQSGMYYNPQDYYGASQQQGYQQPGAAAPSYQTYQAPAPNVQQQASHGKKSSKKQRSAAISANQPQQNYYGQQQPGYYPQQQPQQSAGQYPSYPQQQQQYGQQAYGQPGYSQQQPQTAEPASPSPYGSDPSVQAAQQKAYDRAVARQRAAELAAQQQSAMQELQQTQQMYVAAQQKLKEQEQKQKELQNEYHKKAVGEAYEGLRTAQQRYYDLMGVAQDAARQNQAGQPALASQPQTIPQQAMQYPQAAQAQPSYPQSMPAASYNNPGYAQPSYPTSPGVNTAASPMAPSAVPPGQATPLQIQPQAQPQQESSGGFWGTLKEIFSPPTTGPVPNQRSMWENKKQKGLDEQ